MKILYLFASAESSVAIVTLNQIKALRKYYPTLNIKIACVNYYTERSVLDDYIDYKKEFNSNRIINYYESLVFVKRVKQDFLPDITISNLNAVSIFNVLNDINDIKIGVFHSPLIQFETKSFLTRSVNKISKLFLYKKLDLGVGISTEIVNDLKSNFKDLKVKLFYNIHQKNSIIEKSREKLEINLEKKDKIELLSIGTIDKNKRQDLLIKAIANERILDVKLYIVGNIIDNVYYQKLLDYINLNKLNDKIIFIPFLQNPYPMIKRVDMIISTSESEGLPGVVIESLILNKPVICTNSSYGIWEILNIKNSYNEKINSLVVAEKGIIVPNPKSINEQELIDIINNSIKYINSNMFNFIQNEFVFVNSISDESIILFYKCLEEIQNETIN